MRPLPTLLVVAAVAACAQVETSAVSPVATPAASMSGEPFLLTDPSGAVHMTWLERLADSSHAVRYARLTGETWSAPVTVTARRDLFVNWADFPSVVRAESGRLLVHWLQRRGSGKYAYDVRYAQSADSGKTWSESQLLHRDGKEAEHGFVALWPTAGDSVEAAWLDGRHMTGGDGHGRGAMQVASNRVAPDGSLGAEVVLDARSCECCQVNAAMARSGPVVVYRNRSNEEIRDIAIVRRTATGWSEPAIVHPDGWHLEGCPVNGPAIAARGDTVAVAWFTGARDTARVLVAFSGDGGATFQAPIRVDGGTPVGRVDLELLPSGDAIVAWLERTPPDGGEVRARRVSPAEGAGPTVPIATTSAARAAGFPKIAVTGDALLAAWTVPGDTARVRLGRLALAQLP